MRESVSQSFPPSFQQRCASALTDPVTIGAVVLLFVNDLVLKEIWAGSWLTGKLSDFAWLVFACPLLAFLCSMFTGRCRHLERPAFVVAYLGLPLLYLIFNSSSTVHDLVLSGLLPLTGSVVGSPLDPWDSLMIPLSMAAALWVWCRSGGHAFRYRFRSKFAQVAAVAAMLASVATSPLGVSETQWYVGTDSEGAVVMEVPGISWYASSDGGLSWAPADSRPDRFVYPDEQQVSTPRGVYSLSEAGVWLFRPGVDPDLVFSAAFLTGAPAQWAQRYSRESLDLQVDDPDRERVVSRPVNLVYHESSGNIVVSFAAEGVAVGDPSGSWSRVGVGEFQPTDFSYFGLLALLLGGSFWFGVFSFAVLFAVAGALFSQLPVSQPSTLLKRALVTLLWAAFIVVVLFAIPAVLFLAVAGWTWMAVLLFLGLLIAFARGYVIDMVIPAGLAGLGASVSVVGFPLFSGANLGLEGGIIDAARVFGFLLSLLALALSLQKIRHWLVLAGALLPMSGVIVALSAVWLNGRLSSLVAVSAAVILLVLLAGLLSEYLRRSAGGDGLNP